jgi:hypothetical protein
MPPASSIFVPLADGDEEIEILVEELPEVEDIVEILVAEKASAQIWLKIACAYYYKGDEDSFVKLLTDSNGEQQHDKQDRIAIINALAGHYAKKAVGEKRDNKIREEHLGRAVQLYNDAVPFFPPPPPPGNLFINPPPPPPPPPFKRHVRSILGSVLRLRKGSRAGPHRDGGKY